MDLVDFLYSLSNVELWVFVLILLGIFTSITMILSSKFIALQKRNNARSYVMNLAGLMHSLFSILVGFVVFDLVDVSKTASKTVSKEVDALAQTCHAAEWLKPEIRSHVRSNLLQYANQVLEKEWPDMQKGRPVSEGATRFIRDIRKKIMAEADLMYGKKDLFKYHNVLDETLEIYNIRAERIALSTVHLSHFLWFMILLGTAFLIFSCTIGGGYGLDTLTMAIYTIFLSSAIFLILSLDRPFRGQFRIKPDQFVSLEKRLGHCCEDGMDKAL